MSVFRRVKRVRLKLVEGSSCKSLVLIGFFSASPPPNKMWICDGDRASGILLSFEEEITAREWRRFIGSIGCRFKKELFHIEFKPQKLSLLCESLMKSTSCLWNTLMSRWRRQRSQFQTLHYMLVAWKVFHTFKQSLKRPNVQPIKCQMFKLMLLFVGHHNWTWEKTPKIILNFQF